MPTATATARAPRARHPRASSAAQSAPPLSLPGEGKHLAGITCDFRWSPFDPTVQPFLEYVQGAQESLFVVIYGFHLPALRDELIAKHQAGVTVGLILDHSQASGVAEKADVDALVAAGVPLLIGVSPEHHQILHDKMCVRDGRDVEFGSWNYSESAGFQANVQCYIAGHPDVAAAFLAHYDDLRSVILHSQAMAAYQPQGAVAAPEAPIAVPVPLSTVTPGALSMAAPVPAAFWQWQRDYVGAGAGSASPTVVKPQLCGPFRQPCR